MDDHLTRSLVAHAAAHPRDSVARGVLADYLEEEGYGYHPRQVDTLLRLRMVDEHPVARPYIHGSEVHVALGETPTLGDVTEELARRWHRRWGEPNPLPEHATHIVHGKNGVFAVTHAPVAGESGYHHTARLQWVTPVRDDAPTQKVYVNFHGGGGTHEEAVRNADRMAHA